MKQLFALAPIFADHMIFQAGKSIRIFGTCKNRLEIKIEMNGHSYKLKADDETFLIELPALPVTRTPFSFTVSAKNQSVTLEDCLVGDVFLAGGQSNMQFIVKESYPTEIRENNLIRYYEVPKLPFPDAHLEFPDIYQEPDPKWHLCDKNYAVWFSAIGYHISQSLYQELKIPIGIISCNQGDTSVFSWTDMNFLAQNQKLARYVQYYRSEVSKYPKIEKYHELFHKQLPILLEFYNRINQNIAAGMTSEDAHKKAYEIGDPTLPMGPKHYNRPSGMYDTLLKTIIPFSMKGVLFYQGESDHQNSDLYGEAYVTMVHSWRNAFRDETLPFVSVQLAGYSYPGLTPAGIMPIREAQARSIDVKNGIYMTSAVDLGEENNIHPKEKNVIAKRLFGVVMERIYLRGKNQMCPTAFSVQGAGKRIVLCTQYNDLSLYSKSGLNLGFELSYDGETYVAADKVKLQINQILIECDHPAVKIRYAYKNFPNCDIYASNELPLLPFCLPIVWPKP